MIKMKTTLLNRKVTNPSVTFNSPNKIGVITDETTIYVDHKRIKSYKIEFRDYREFWSEDYIIKNLIKNGE